MYLSKSMYRIAMLLLVGSMIATGESLAVAQDEAPAAPSDPPKDASPVSATELPTTAIEALPHFCLNLDKHRGAIHLNRFIGYAIVAHNSRCYSGPLLLVQIDGHFNHYRLLGTPLTLVIKTEPHSGTNWHEVWVDQNDQPRTFLQWGYRYDH